MNKKVPVLAAVAVGTALSLFVSEAVFTRITLAESFSLTQTFLNPTPDFLDRFGISVSLSGNQALIGTPSEDMGGAPDFDSGAAYLFDSATGNLLRTFFNPTPDPGVGLKGDSFGGSVSISGNNALIGARFDDQATTDSGAAYLFDATTGSLLHTFFHPTPGSFDFFGWSVAISGGNALIGAPLFRRSGQAFLFDAGTGHLLQTFLNPKPDGLFDEFGAAVAIEGNKALIGSPYDSTFPIPDPGQRVDAAYLFNAVTGDLLQTFPNPTSDIFDEFGREVAISGNKVLIGAPFDDTAGTDSGAAYLFDATTGELLQTFLNPMPKPGDFFIGSFARSVAISGNKILIGASSADAGAIESGIAYLFDATSGELLQTFLKPSPGVTDLFGTSVAIDGDKLLISAPGHDMETTASGAAYLYQQKRVPEPTSTLGLLALGIFGASSSLLRKKK